MVRAERGIYLAGAGGAGGGGRRDFHPAVQLGQEAPSIPHHGGGVWHHRPDRPAAPPRGTPPQVNSPPRATDSPLNAGEFTP
eukprot:1122722-Prorocentrum_minimum.AAC.1